jgi:chromosome segregation ATPase
MGLKTLESTLRLGYTKGVTPTEYEQLAERLDRLAATVDRLAATVERQFANVGQQFAVVAQHFAAVDRRFDGVQRQIDDLRQEMLGHFDEIYRGLERLDQEYLAITHGLRRIEGALADERGRRDILEREVGDLKRRLSTLEARLAELEQRLQQ